MPLNNDQIELINSFLVKNEVVFDGVRHEVIDHIASDIEHNYENVAFHEAIKIVLQKWQSQIKLSESIWVSTWSSFPVLILKKLKNLLQPFGILFISLLIILSLLLSYYPAITAKINKNISYEIGYLTWVAISTGFGLNLFFSKGHTTYKYVFKRILYVIFMNSIIVFSDSANKDNVLTSILIINTISSIFLVKCYKAHFKFLKDNLLNA
ncbi:hypothetical protein FIA58_014875 [Flavobacterium jejuense]|uniref:DUF2157 domain-containing protein n=1 Tax=Flavobacterium jejuense TaxID=1544455 RepID=A0ABX0IUY2_9FLAO|nr:hypothetical protein [Flavobacterium jejuense]NHN26965.1 hypothetical protein [Flavobacterium jejuense]